MSKLYSSQPTSRYEEDAGRREGERSFTLYVYSLFRFPTVLRHSGQTGTTVVRRQQSRKGSGDTSLLVGGGQRKGMPGIIDREVLTLSRSDKHLDLESF